MAWNGRPNQPNKYQQGYYKLQNPHKYIGNPTEIVYRSSYEKRFCIYADMNPKVLRWGSEVNSIPYIGPDGREHKYHIDFFVEMKHPTNPDLTKQLIIEVKPSNELRPPQKPKKWSAKSMKNYEYSLKTYHKNIHKWTAAQEYAQNRGMEFVIIHEGHLQKLR